MIAHLSEYKIHLEGTDILVSIIVLGVQVFNLSSRRWQQT
jgi:hypothetical protein